MENHPKRYLLEIQRFGSPGFGLKLSGQGPIRPHTHTQLQAKSWRPKPLNFQKISFGVVPHTILLGIRGVTKFFWSIDPLYCIWQLTRTNFIIDYVLGCKNAYVQLRARMYFRPRGAATYSNAHAAHYIIRRKALHTKLQSALQI